MVRKQTERATAFLFFAVSIAALGGFLYGYHTGIISGVLVYLTPFFRLSILEQGMAVSMILIGALIGALVAGTFADLIGRKKTIAATSILFIIGAAIISLSGSFGTLLSGRFISGLGVGVVSVVAPIYLAEISPPHHRGSLVACYQLAIAIGILISYIVNYLFSISADWRWMFAIGIFPALFQVFSLFFVPETPAWLFKNGREKEGVKVLRRLRGDKGWANQVSSIESSASHHKHGNWKALFSPQMRFVMIIGFCLSIFQQITGINIIFYYTPKIFETVGFNSTTGAIFATIGIGIINVIITYLSTVFLDRIGRRILLLIGVGGMAICLGVLSLSYFLSLMKIEVVTFFSIIGYVAFFSIGMGPVTWVILSEIYPLKVRGKAMTVVVFGNWLFNYLVSLTFLSFIEKLKPAGTFLLYALISVVAFWFIALFIPETKGKSLEEIEELLIRR